MNWFVDATVLGVSRSAERRALRLPVPRDVPGFLEADSAGLLPWVPVNPPSRPSSALIPTASDMTRRTLVRAVSLGSTSFGFAFGVTPRVDVPYEIDSWLGGVLITAWMWLLIRWLKESGERMLEECLHGYATSTLQAGNFRLQQHAAWAATEIGMPWDFSGVWVVDRKFKVKSAPQLGYWPPGFYPSPNEPGRWEIWTGVVWSGTFDDGPALRSL